MKFLVGWSRSFCGEKADVAFAGCWQDGDGEEDDAESAYPMRHAAPEQGAVRHAGRENAYG